MNIAPPKRRHDRPICLIEPGIKSVAVHDDFGTYRASGPSGCYELLSRFEGHICYVGGALTTLRHVTGAMSWEATTWRGRAVAMMLDGTKVKVHSLRGTLDRSPEKFAALTRAIDWLRGQGVPPGSISTMAWNLWRNTLASDLMIAADPRVSRSALYGGRQECSEPRVYQHQASFDISQAYAHSMASRPYALGLRRVSADTRIDPSRAGLVAASVDAANDMPYAPLPARVGPDAIQFQWGRVEGVWPWTELAAVIELGCPVDVKAVWAPTREADIFARWWTLAQDGRTLAGESARLIKAVINSLWGQFGMRGNQRARVRWTNDTGEHSVKVAGIDRYLPHASTCHVAAETAGRVRSRMLIEGLYGSRYRPVHIDTDGIIARRSSPVPGPGGEGPGTWQRKATYRTLDVRGPQVYRYTCGAGCGVLHAKWHFSVAGVPSSMAPRLFDHFGSNNGLRAGIRGNDIVLAPGHRMDRARTDNALLDARIAQVEAFGRPLDTESETR